MVIKLKLFHSVRVWYSRDNFMAFQEQSSSAVLLGPNWSNTKYVYLLGSSAILGM